MFVTTLKFGFSLLSASLAGACLVLPVIIRTTEEALLTVPDSYRQGSLALGATKWQTIQQVILPASLPGIITGIILSVGRVVSETAVFYVTLGGSYRMPTSIMSSGRTMALHLYYLAMDTRAFEKSNGHRRHPDCQHYSDQPCDQFLVPPTDGRVTGYAMNNTKLETKKLQHELWQLSRP